jgi:hypothetical protein
MARRYDRKLLRPLDGLRRPSKSWLPLLCVGLLIAALAYVAASSRRASHEPRVANAVTAVGANTVLTSSDTQERGIDLTDLLDMVVDHGEIQIHQQIGDRLLLGIMDLAGKLYILLLVGCQQLLPNLFSQFEKALLQLFLQLTDLRV